MVGSGTTTACSCTVGGSTKRTFWSQVSHCTRPIGVLFQFHSYAFSEVKAFDMTRSDLSGCRAWCLSIQGQPKTRPLAIFNLNLSFYKL